MKHEQLIESSLVYLIDPVHLRELGVELKARNRDNAFRSHGDRKHLSDEERARIYDELKEKIKPDGFRTDQPITVMLRRKDDQHDKILQGHHRLAIAVELGLDVVPVRFVCKAQNQTLDCRTSP